MAPPPRTPAFDVDKALDEAGFPQSFGQPTSGAPRFTVEELASVDPRMGIPEGWQMIHVLMGRILADVGPVLKSQVNTHQKYNFRGIDQVLNAVHDIFARHQVYPVSSVKQFALRDCMTTGTEKTAPRPTREATMVINFRFYAPDGSYVDTEVPGEALDTSDKTTPKAMSVALRIALIQMLLMRTDEPTTDHEYNTRDGVGSMAASVAAYVASRITDAGLVELVGPIRKMITEHSAWDRPTPGPDDAPTWHDAFAARLVQIIQAADDRPTLVDIHSVLEAERLLGGKTALGTPLELLNARWLALRELYVNTLNHVTGQILAAKGQDELEIAISCGHAALEAKSLRQEDLDKAVAIAEERRAKLPEFAPRDEPEPEDEEDNSPEDDEESEAIRGAIEAGARVSAEADDEDPQATRLDPTSSASIDAAAQRARERHERVQEELKAFALVAAQAPLAGLGEEPSIRDRAVRDAIGDLLAGTDDHPAASAFGAHGFQLVRDAIVAAHRREQSISDTSRHALEELLAAAEAQ